MHSAHSFPTPASGLPDADLPSRLAHQQRFETLGMLAGGVAHDLNNLLTGILGHVEAAEALLTPNHPARSELALVHGVTHRAATLTRRVLDFGRRPAGERSALNVVALFEDSLQILRATLPRHLELRPLFEVGCAMVVADPTELQQVLFNLAINAAQALGGDEGTIQVGVSRLPAGSAPRVDVGELGHGPHICVTVSDTGGGIDPAVRTQIFEPFFTTKPAGVGTGLGLTIVRNLVLQHGGAIGVHSVPGEGTIFRLYLPEVAPAPAILGTPKPEPRPALAHIAIIDDEETVVRLAKQALEFAGYRTSTMASAEECLEHVDAGAGYDLILTDQRMPAMSGVDLARALRARGATTPVLITSGSIASVTLRELQVVAPARFIAKPFTLVELLGSVKELLAARAPAR